SGRRRHTRCLSDWSSDVCSSDLLDSAFLIDLLRERSRERPEAAFEYIESLDPQDILAISLHVACELRAGAELSRHPLRTHQQLRSEEHTSELQSLRHLVCRLLLE